ncbi:MAG TPA: P-loop NTPase, partial [Desulfurivibrionaceae bacterium]|nr:P-loop NTPase [Desulfurivibrionaceae bacterium]
MLQTEHYSPEELKKIQRACCRVFMSEQAMHSVMPPRNNRKTLHYPFLEQLTYDAVKRAYRANMLAHHPDRHQDKHPEEIAFFARHVEGVNRSYEYLASLFGEKKSALPPPEETKRRRIIAVGGAKGGIGKSLFAANLGMMLSSMGFKTVMVDLDLGGSNLHIYLGLNNIQDTTISDFLERKVASLHDVAIDFADGPTLIAGNTGELGAANIPFQKKMR